MKDFPLSSGTAIVLFLAGGLMIAIRAVCFVQDLRAYEAKPPHLYSHGDLVAGLFT